jgi:hypothetical protein
MYNLDPYEKALTHFGTRVDIIIAMEMGGKISEQAAYKNIKMEFKELKRIRKSLKKEQDM